MLPIPIKTFQLKKSKRYSSEECIIYYKKFLNQFSFLNDRDLTGLEKYWTYYSLKRNLPALGSNFAGNSVKFICQGAAKLFGDDASGQRISAFITEGHFCTSMLDFTQQVKTEDVVTSVEPIYGMEITFEKYQLLLRERPAFARLFKLLLQEELDFFKNRVMEFQGLNALGRYKLLLVSNPEAFHRFKVGDISSYLGIEPETLSRIRLAESKKEH